MVQDGPFAGLRLVGETSWGFLAPLLVGSYDEELHPALEYLIATAPKRIINIGSAEGYYAVGFARRLPEAEIYAFDVDEEAQRLTGENAAVNGVGDRVHVGGACTIDNLERLITPRTMPMVDCEGCEVDLLLPDRARSLRLATMLVELHDFIRPEASAAITARFRETHSIELIRARERSLDDYPTLDDLDPRDRSVAVAERRPIDQPAMEWVVLRPRLRTQ